MDCSTADSLKTLMRTYATTQTPIGVDFRRLVPWIASIDRATHLIHPYPAKLLVHIPHFFLANNILSRPGDIVLDPFCGSGTVLLEALLAKRSAVGADSNPLARLISRVKTTVLDIDSVQLELDRVKRDSRLVTDVIPPPDVINLEYWFPKHVIQQLSRLAYRIKLVDQVDMRDFLLVCLSSVIRRVSLADPRLSVPVRLRPNKYPEGHWFHHKALEHLDRLNMIDVVDLFSQVASVNVRRLTELQRGVQSSLRATITSTDAADLMDPNEPTQRLRESSIQLAITSPPYAGAQKYIRASSLNLGWLGLSSSRELRFHEKKTIGREHFPRDSYKELVVTGIEPADQILEQIHRENPLRAHIAGTYLIEMRRAILELQRAIKPDGYLVLVAANNRVCNREFATFEFLSRYILGSGFEKELVLCDDIRSRSLMTKRHRTAGIITREWIGVFRKRG